MAYIYSGCFLDPCTGLQLTSERVQGFVVSLFRVGRVILTFAVRVCDLLNLRRGAF